VPVLSDVPSSKIPSSFLDSVTLLVNPRDPLSRVKRDPRKAQSALGCSVLSAARWIRILADRMTLIFPRFAPSLASSRANQGHCKKHGTKRDSRKPLRGKMMNSLPRSRIAHLRCINRFTSRACRYSSRGFTRNVSAKRFTRRAESPGFANAYRKILRHRSVVPRRPIDLRRRSANFTLRGWIWTMRISSGSSGIS